MNVIYKVMNSLKMYAEFQKELNVYVSYFNFW